MGLLDIFGRRPKPSDQRSGTSPAARCDHYTFAHVVLRDAVFDNPTQAVSQLGSSASGDFLALLWEQVISICQHFQQPVTVNADDILIHKIPVGTFPCALIEMPTPQYETEAFFIALVLTLDMSDQSWKDGTRVIRFLTLEFERGNERELRTVIGEWSSRERYISHGPGTYPSVDQFIAKVTELVVPKSIHGTRP